MGVSPWIGVGWGREYDRILWKRMEAKFSAFLMMSSRSCEASMVKTRPLAWLKSSHASLLMSPVELNALPCFRFSHRVLEPCTHLLDEHVGVVALQVQYLARGQPVLLQNTHDVEEDGCVLPLNFKEVPLHRRVLHSLRQHSVKSLHHLRRVLPQCTFNSNGVKEALLRVVHLFEVLRARVVLPTELLRQGRPHSCLPRPRWPEQQDDGFERLRGRLEGCGEPRGGVRVHLEGLLLTPRPLLLGSAPFERSVLGGERLCIRIQPLLILVGVDVLRVVGRGCFLLRLLSRHGAARGCVERGGTRVACAKRER
eukprot:Sspe_Gene.12015::Locus_4091_Transcript_1_1_Confidence_1.000_Length_2311::g.12015::m.12015